MDEDNQNVTVGQLQGELSNAMNGWKRAQADFENFKKQKERENKELLEFAKEVAVVKLLPTLDALEQALRHMPEYVESNAPVVRPFMSQGENADKSANYGEGENNFSKTYSNWQIGVNGIVIQLDKVLGELGVKKIEAVGKKFDPHVHEAIRETESDGEEGMVIDELQSGFILNDKVVRPSQVVISKKKE